MKNLLKSTLIAGAILLTLQAAGNTPTLRDTTKFTSKIKKGAAKVAHKTAQIAVKGESAVVDKVYKGKMGPDGQTIYINKHDNYYYVNKRGAKVYLKKTQLRNKPTA